MTFLLFIEWPVFHILSRSALSMRLDQGRSSDEGTGFGLAYDYYWAGFVKLKFLRFKVIGFAGACWLDAV